MDKKSGGITVGILGVVAVIISVICQIFHDGGIP
jgi:hypothetical protein